MPPYYLFGILIDEFLYGFYILDYQFSLDQAKSERMLVIFVFQKLTKKRGRITIVAFTNAAGTGRGILAKQGFSEISYHDMPKELFTIGPKYRGKSEFGYKMFVKHVTASSAKHKKKVSD